MLITFFNTSYKFYAKCLSNIANILNSNKKVGPNFLSSTKVKLGNIFYTQEALIKQWILNKSQFCQK